MPLDSAAKAGAPRTFQALALVKVRRVRKKVEASLAPLAEFNRYPLLFLQVRLLIFSYDFTINDLLELVVLNLCNCSGY